MTALDDDPGVVYPVGLTLLDRRVVVVGGGRFAHRRVAGLVAARARVTVVSPEVTPALESLAAAGTVTWLRRPYASGDLAGSWYAVAATDDPVVNAAVGEEAERDRVFCDRAVDSQAADASGTRAVARTGRVTLVGGGPGAPDLVTVRGHRAIHEADVVVADHLGPQALLATLPPEVEVIDASKLPRGRSMAQERINALLVEHALAGKRVVRLKGGDSFVFGRGMEEVAACAAAGIPVEVVPGITSAVAVPALAGIPVTHRGMTHEFVVVSGHLPPGHPESLVDWSCIGRLRGTVVVLMGVETAGAIAAALVEHGRAPETPVAVVVDGSTTTQRTVRTTLAELRQTMADEGIQPPAVWVVGDVVGLAATSPEGFRVTDRTETPSRSFPQP